MFIFIRAIKQEIFVPSAILSTKVRGERECDSSHRRHLRSVFDLLLISRVSQSLRVASVALHGAV